MYIINHHLICSLGSLNLIQKAQPALNPMLFIVAIVSIDSCFRTVVNYSIHINEDNMDRVTVHSSYIFFLF